MRVLAAAALLVMLVPSSSYAGTVSSTDPVADLDHGADILSVTLAHKTRLKIDVEHANLRRHPHRAAGLTVFLDTDPTHEGPEYLLGTGLLQGTDFLLSEADGWKAGDPVTCPYDVELDYTAERTHVWLGRRCFESPDLVRISVKVAAEAGHQTGDVMVDWWREYRQFSRWVPQF